MFDRFDDLFEHVAKHGSCWNKLLMISHKNVEYQTPTMGSMVG
jgi:hypothetical protein